MFLKYNVPAALCEQCTVRRVALGRARINSALLSLTHLLPRILVGYWAVLELLAAEGYFLVVLLAVCPILLEVYAVAACTLDGLHG